MHMAKKSVQQQKERLFEEKLVPAEPGSGKLFDVNFESAKSAPVECLGLKFPNDEARRAYFTEILRRKLKDPEFRNAEGFPIASNEEILRLSDPPYFTACPNPFLDQVVSCHGRQTDLSETYDIAPLASDVAEGRHTWIYKAHTYHTKVPPKAIAKYIDHYTSPGDIVLDGFSGSGMTALASMMCDQPRTALACDLSPAAAFISSIYLLNVDPDVVRDEAMRIADLLDSELGWMYRPGGNTDSSPIANYYVWSDVFLCSSCGSEIKFWEAAFDPVAKKFSDQFACASCGALNSKSSAERATDTIYDHLLKQPWVRFKQVPVVATVSSGGRRAYKRRVNDDDLRLLAEVRSVEPPPGAQRFAVKMLFRDGQWGDQWKNCMHLRPITHAHQLFTERQLHYIGRFLDALDLGRPEHRAVLFAGTSILQKTSRLMVYNADGIGRVQKGTLYISSVCQEMRFSHMLRITAGDLLRAAKEGLWTTLPKKRSKVLALHAVWAGSSTSIPLADETVDYVFVDPPFGSNIPYSELNFLWEAALGVATNVGPEAIESQIQGKSLLDYQDLMERCFSEFKRVLKPRRWITVEFHNSKNSVWNCIQEALMRAGFVVADVRILDKKQKSFKQATTAGAVKQDLIITAYRPPNDLEVRCAIAQGSESSAWEFVRAHLERLPVFGQRNGKVEVLVERQKYLLFDRMVAFHVQRGHAVPLSSSEFYSGLAERFEERDGMYFLTHQTQEYDRQRLDVQEVEQLELFVSEERGAIQWLRRALRDRPMRMQELQPLFMREAQRAWDKNERPMELRSLLEENFLQDDHEAWHIPDVKKESHLEQLRQRSLIREFQQYYGTSGRLKVVRAEALRAGFKEAWQKKDYTTIVQMAKRVPEVVIQEDQALLMYVDNASLMLGE